MLRKTSAVTLRRELAWRASMRPQRNAAENVRANGMKQKEKMMLQ